MSSELDEVSRALFNGQIPAIWRRLAPATLKSLGNWMIHFERRLRQYNAWVSLRLKYSLVTLMIFLHRMPMKLTSVYSDFFSQLSFLF